MDPLIFKQLPFKHIITKNTCIRKRLQWNDETNYKKIVRIISLIKKSATYEIVNAADNKL